MRYLKITLGLEAKEIYRSIKDRCRKDVEFGNSAGAIINLLWENRIDAKKNMPVSDNFFSDEKMNHQKADTSNQLDKLKIITFD